MVLGPADRVNTWSDGAPDCHRPWGRLGGAPGLVPVTKKNLLKISRLKAQILAKFFLDFLDHKKETALALDASTYLHAQSFRPRIVM